MLKKLSLAVAVASTTLTGLAYAETVDTPVGKLDVTMTATLASDWISRGVSINDAPTVQGSLDVAHESGLYVGIWGGSYAGSAGGVGGSEFDYYIGYGAAINDDVSFDVTLATYTYPETNDDDDVELIGSVSAYNATVGAKYRFEATKQTYVFAGYDFALPADFGLTLNVGHTMFDDEAADGPNYTDWGVTLSRAIAGVNAAVSYTSTDIDDCDACENNVTFSVSKTF